MLCLGKNTLGERGADFMFALTRSKGGGVIPFVYEDETETLVAAFSTPPTARRKKTINRAIKALKAAGVWSKLIGFWRVGNDQQSSLLNWKTPGTYTLTVTGSPTFNANSHWAPAASAGLRTGILLNALNTSDVAFGFYSKTSGATATTDMGARDATNGFTINAKSTAANKQAARCGSAVNTGPGATADWDGLGFHAVTRVDGTNFDNYRGPVNKATVATASASITATHSLYLLGENTNGSLTASSRNQSCWFISTGLTAAQMKVLANVVHQLDIEIEFGEYDEYDAGYEPAQAAYDLVVYGATPGGLVAAYEARRQGLEVAIVGGWRDRHAGGMMTGGLGSTDFEAESAWGGLPRWVITQIQAKNGNASDDFEFEPRLADQVFRSMFDPRRTNGLDVPIYWSNGVVSVSKNGARITGIRTADGRAYTADYFIDASYEGDLMKRAGISTRLGREAAGSGGEAYNGYRGTTTSDGGTTNQFFDHDGVSLVNIDPYIVPGDSGSGLLYGLGGTVGVDTPAVGAADARIQSYNFRVTRTSNAAYQVPFSSTPPDGYDASHYEALGRLLDAEGATLDVFDLMKLVPVDGAATVYDINHSNGLSLNLLGGSWDYPEASYAQREVIWKRHENWIRGLFYYLQYEDDSRVPSALRTVALNLQLHQWHYNRPHPNDDYNWMPQLYVREAFRLDNDFMMTGDDLIATDGTTPRSVKTISATDYTMDSHHMWALADPNGGTPRIWNEGNFNVAAGDTDKITPVPIEVALPRKTECENLAVVFAVAATHVAFGAIRMELASMQMGQSMAMATKQAIDNSNQALQDIDYPTLRTALLASAALTGEVAPVLPQTN